MLKSRWKYLYSIGSMIKHFQKYILKVFLKVEVFVFVGLNWDYDMIFYNIFINIWKVFLKVEVFVFVGLNWEDAPPEQFAVRGVDYKVIRLHII